MSQPSTPGTLERLRDAKEVDIETRSPAGEAHRATIWVVVDAVRPGAGALLEGTRRALVPRGGRRRPRRPRSRRDRLPVRVERATDPARIDACSRELLAKYGTGATARSMVREEILDTTLELHSG